MGIVENTYAELKQQELKNNPYSCLHMADIDINPHQVEAFTFALSSLELGGAILADEVGLGKTIEAGLVIKYLLCSGKNKILLIMPSNLRKQWQVELEEKFDIDSLIVDSSNWEDYLANILFFDNTHPTEETWFYRLDMPEGYKNFSKTKPMKLEHFAPAIEWWDNREEIEVDGFPKAKKYTVDEIAANGYNIDLCGFPHEEEEILDPMDLINQYQEKRASLNAEIDHVLEKITSMLGGN